MSYQALNLVIQIRLLGGFSAVVSVSASMLRIEVSTGDPQPLIPRSRKRGTEKCENEMCRYFSA